MSTTTTRETTVPEGWVPVYDDEKTIWGYVDHGDSRSYGPLEPEGYIKMVLIDASIARTPESRVHLQSHRIGNKNQIRALHIMLHHALNWTSSEKP